MKNYILSLYRKLPIDFRKKVKNIFVKEPEVKEILNQEEFLYALKKYDVISFDIFDTLVTRCVYNPDDVFNILSEYLKDPNFLLKRKKAEQNARNRYNYDVNLSEIYSQYKLDNNISSSEAKKIEKLEINLEKELIVARRDMIDILKELKKAKKTVILTSDMYLPKTAIIEILDKCGYNKIYDEIYVSNDIKKRKDTKEIWPFIKNIYDGKKIIHVGDNNLSDVEYPKEFNISTIKVNSSKELLQKSLLFPSLEECINNRTTSDSIYLGLVFNKKMYNSPFSSLKIDNFENFVYMFHAPIITEFLKFVIDSQAENLLFLAREGYYFTKLYKKYCSLNKINLQNNYYFLASRKATNTASINNEDDILAILKNEYDGNLSKFLLKNFNIKYKGHDFKIKLPNDYEKVLKVINQNKKEINANIKEEKKCYKKYIKELIPGYKKQDLSLIDLGYSGSIQYNLSKLLEKDLNGYYLTNSNSVKRYTNGNNLYFYFDINNDKEYQKIYHYSLILEYFLTAPYGQLQYFKEANNKITPVYNEEKLDSKKQQNLNKIYTIIVDYFNDIKPFTKYIKYYPSKKLLCRNYTATVESNIIDKCVKDEFSFIDAYSGEEEKNVFKIISRY